MEVSQIICMGILTAVSVIDIRCREIPLKLLAASGIGAAAYQAFGLGEDFLLIVGGAAVGVLFVLISRVTGEGVGYGDSLGILGLGIYLGLWRLLEVLAGAFFLLALCAGAVLIRKKMSRKASLPFYPFLTAAYVFWMIGEI